MKKIYTLICFIVLINITTKAQYVTITDANFAAWLNANLPSAMSNGNQMDTTSTAVTSLISMNLSGISIVNIAEIQYFDSLKILNCSGDFMNVNLLTSFPDLPSSLQVLDCSYNQITSLSNLPNTLVELNCSYNQITSLPVLPNSLLTLKCGYNQLTSLPALPNTLKILNYFHNSSLNNLLTLPDSLQTLDCAENNIINLPSLPNGLKYLNCSVNPSILIPVLPPLLEEFFCAHNQLTSLPALPALLKTLHCAHNQLTSLPELPESFYSLICSYNQLTSLPALPDQFYNLNCAYNNLSSLPIIPNSLGILDCSNNLLTSLPPLPASALQQLFCQNNNISCFPPFPNSISPSVQFDISGNPFTCLPNYISAMVGQTLAYPLCEAGDLINNPNGCISAFGILGLAYQDNDSNCSINGMENALNNLSFKIFENQTLVGQTLSSTNGTYYFSDTLGTYTVKIDTAGMPFFSLM